MLPATCCSIYGAELIAQKLRKPVLRLLPSRSGPSGSAETKWSRQCQDAPRGLETRQTQADSGGVHWVRFGGRHTVGDR